jgi:hypothetical protein
MEKKIKSLTLVISLILVSITCACSANRINLAKTGTVFLDVVPSKSFDLEKVAVYQEDNNAIVKGQVWLTKHFKPGDYGHIDIEKLDAKNTVTENYSVFHKPRILPIAGRRPAYFKASLSSVPQPESRVRVTYHQPDNSVAKVFCSQKTQHEISDLNHL